MMFKQRKQTTLQVLIKDYKVKKVDIANRLGLSPHQVARILKKDIDDITIGQLRAIVSCTGMDLSIYIDEKIY